MGLRYFCLQIACFLAVWREIQLVNSDDRNELTPHTDRFGKRIQSEQTSRRRVDAEDSWLSFIRHSKRLQSDKHTDRKRKNRRTQRLVDVFQNCPPGPPGPRGPPGPPGPKGAHVTFDVMMNEFRELVKEEAEKRANELLILKCPECMNQSNGTSSLPEVFMASYDVSNVPRITSGFHLRLRKNVVVADRTLKELELFHQPFAAGSFQRGRSFNVRNGRFSAPTSGIYQFSANLHIRVKRKGRKAKLKRKDIVTALICIESLCQHHVSLQHLVALEDRSRLFTVSFSGFLQLQAGQYASIYVDNASNLNVVVKSESDFSGVFIGT